MTQSRWITGGGGLRLNLVSEGPEGAPPILFIHGFACSHMSWRHQFASSLAERFTLFALDSRGHGMSDAPPGPELYNQSRLWAEDIAAAVEACGKPPVICGWSYGGLAIGDYLRHFGDTGLAGIVLVAAVMGQGQEAPAPTATSDKPMYSADIARFIPALIDLAGRATEEPMGPEDFAEFVAVMARVPAHVRLGINMRTESFLDDYATVTKPVWILFGDRDRIVSPREGDEAKRVMPHATQNLWEGIGHIPFREAPDRFNAELAAFAGACFERAAA